MDWLLEDNDPSIKYLALTDLLGQPDDSPVVMKAKSKIARSARVSALLSGQKPDGGFGCHPYTKWRGAHWRLVSLVELALPESNRRAIKAANTVLDWLTGPAHKKSIRVIDSLTRRCASQEGNALAVCSRLGMADDPRVRYLAESLIAWQWPDGGWNCDKEKDACHSSFHESVIPMWGLIEYHRATGHRASLAAAKRTAEFVLRHRLFRSETTGETINPKWLMLHWPHYWHYDILQGLRVLSMLPKVLNDIRARAALDIVEQKQLPDGRWKADGYYWKLPNARGLYMDPVDWWRGKPNKMLTLNALRVLNASGRVKL
ncbi:MAG: hypothetical protein A2W25_03775 [candidate division Zixibacteria bacterium RBG_16_53_22]|nr:MAG: hypothetical protein A2W25_03775 [candidate division Zixibacteria bacterium RBG_16_53_22]